MRVEFGSWVFGLLNATSFSSPPKSAKINARQLVELPNVWIENVALRSNGNLLLTTFGNGDIYSVDPSIPEARVVAKVKDIDALTGIAEVDRDLFVVSGGIYDGGTYFEEGSMKILLVDFRECGESHHGSPLVHPILEGKDAGVINGMTALPDHQHIVLGAASWTGEIWRINTKTRTSKVILRDDLLAAIPTGPYPLGVNGLKISRGYLYFTNTGRQLLGRFKIDEFGNKIGDVEVIWQAPADTKIAPDDFSLDQDGNALVGCFPDLLIKITPDGEQTVLVNGTLAGGTSTVFSKDGKSLFVVTTGKGVKGVTGGQLVQVDL
ncbi:uncharacterized protein NECHADRAFT_82000 [Fusarium vanettenii 77-13-4]|uniref:SMP-30/Gluconolactonase/LRE-like region domain-containing protein n=1 Tax=Fusarium vanettenii (strain ATCC MYA-4622 / CBS 123669 / FGSC 9596 / NRRL 45880 / 77-13-4) TaxID=660122 RepID=C7ZA74_FUSV7|nr:uncharacterized protein NECHADRAFT_82000 [Fusarium vanettenii 77-13-4]EEU39224.1 hypothetical protein NECHADRAFT_82000 [Fusarium vanettenii 77-13-4]